MAALPTHSVAPPAVDVLALVESMTGDGLLAALRGFQVHVSSAATFLAQLDAERPKVVLLAIPPADSEVLEAVAAVRRRRPALRSVLMNAEGGVNERLHALELGYDAALPAETPMAEVAGRVALLARGGVLDRTRLRVGEGLELDLSRGCLLRNGRQVHLRPKEYHLLELLARHPGRAYTRAELLARVWDPGREGNPRTVDVHIRWLRSKVERDPDQPIHLVTVRGRGYRLEPEAY